MIWKELLEKLKSLSDEQLSQPVQVVKTHPSDDHVHECLPGVAFETVDDLEFRYIRSVVDNKRHGEHFVLFVDYGPFGEDGAIGYELEEDDEIPIYPEGHSAEADWTGPAQELLGNQKSSLMSQKTAAILVNRLKKLESITGSENDLELSDS